MILDICGEGIKNPEQNDRKLKCQLNFNMTSKVNEKRLVLKKNMKNEIGKNYIRIKTTSQKGTNLLKIF